MRQPLRLANTRPGHPVVSRHQNSEGNPVYLQNRSRRHAQHGSLFQPVRPPKIIRFSFISFPAACTPGTVSGASANTGGGNSTSGQRAARNASSVSGSRRNPLSAKSAQRVRRLPIVPGGVYAGNGFRCQRAHWRRKQYVRSASRPKRFQRFRLAQEPLRAERCEADFSATL